MTSIMKPWTSSAKTSSFDMKSLSYFLGENNSRDKGIEDGTPTYSRKVFAGLRYASQVNQPRRNGPLSQDPLHQNYANDNNGLRRKLPPRLPHNVGRVVQTEGWEPPSIEQQNTRPGPSSGHATVSPPRPSPSSQMQYTSPSSSGLPLTGSEPWPDGSMQCPQQQSTVLINHGGQFIPGRLQNIVTTNFLNQEVRLVSGQPMPTVYAVYITPQAPERQSTQSIYEAPNIDSGSSSYPPVSQQPIQANYEMPNSVAGRSSDFAVPSEPSDYYRLTDQEKQELDDLKITLNDLVPGSPSVFNQREDSPPIFPTAVGTPSMSPATFAYSQSPTNLDTPRNLDEEIGSVHSTVDLDAIPVNPSPNDRYQSIYAPASVPQTQYASRPNSVHGSISINSPDPRVTQTSVVATSSTTGPFLPGPSSVANGATTVANGRQIAAVVPTNAGMFPPPPVSIAAKGGNRLASPRPRSQSRDVPRRASIGTNGNPLPQASPTSGRREVPLRVNIEPNRNPLPAPQLNAQPRGMNRPASVELNLKSYFTDEDVRHTQQLISRWNIFIENPNCILMMLERWPHHPIPRRIVMAFIKLKYEVSNGRHNYEAVKEALNYCDRSGMNAIMFCAIHNLNDIMGLFLSYRPSLTAEGSYSQQEGREVIHGTAVQFAIRFGHYEIVKLLVESEGRSIGDDVQRLLGQRVNNNYGSMDALELAVYLYQGSERNDEMVKFLFQHQNPFDAIAMGAASSYAARLMPLFLNELRNAASLAWFGRSEETIKSALQNRLYASLTLSDIIYGNVHLTTAQKLDLIDQLENWRE